MNKTIIFSILIGILIIAGCTQISKNNSNFINCKDDYDCLYNEIKNGNSAKVIITEEVESLNIIEKSSVEIQPNNNQYKVTMKVIDLKKIKSDSEMDVMVDSISEAISETCPQIINNLNKIESKSAVCYTNTPEEAKELTIQGLNDDFISKYNCKGELIDTITDICVTPQFPNFPPGVDKPAVYLYPESEMNIKVSVNVNGYITKSIPTYGIGYDVTAKPNGLIDDKYDYLFYEAQLNNIVLPNTGWVVKSNDLEAWFNFNLVKLGLNQNEIEQFKEYWIPRLSESDLYEIKLIENNFLVENMNLIIEPKPDTLIRTIFYFKPIDEKIEITEPTIETPERIGFTVVEWGGLLDN